MVQTAIVVMVLFVIGIAYWLLRKPKASLEGTTVTGQSLMVKVSGYSGNVYVVVRSTKIDFLLTVLLPATGEYSIASLTPNVDFDVYVLNEGFDKLLASGTYKTAQAQSPN